MTAMKEVAAMTTVTISAEDVHARGVPRCDTAASNTQTTMLTFNRDEEVIETETETEKEIVIEIRTIVAAIVP